MFPASAARPRQPFGCAGSRTGTAVHTASSICHRWRLTCCPSAGLAPHLGAEFGSPTGLPLDLLPFTVTRYLARVRQYSNIAVKNIVRAAIVHKNQGFS